MRVVLCITGASGVIYGIRALEELQRVGVETHLVVSRVACDVIRQETSYTIQEVMNLASYCYDESDLTASINSGSFKFDCCLVIPCSMKSLSGIAHGYADNSITRVADVTLKERRKLVIVPRETPLRTTHLENMARLSREGAIILPAMPAFYHNPESVDEQVNFIVGKLFDILGIENDLFRKWK